jgi:hypothetical protein
MVIYFDDQLASGKKGIYTIFAEVASLDRVGDNIQLQLRKNTELVAQEKSTNFRVAYENEATASTATVPGSWTLQNYSFIGGKITFTNSSNFPKTIEAAASSTDVEIAKGTLTVAEPIKLSDLEIEATVDTKDSTRTTALADDAAYINAHIKTLKVEIGGSTYTATATAAGTKVTYKITDDMYVSRTSDIRVLVNLTTDDYVDTIKFTSIQ